MMVNKTEKNTKRILGIFYLVLGVMFAITVFGWIDTSPYFLPIIAGFMGLVLLSEAGVNQYFVKSTYQSINPKEVLGLASVLTGAGLLILGITMFGFLPVGANEFIVSTFGRTAGVVAIGGAIFSLIHFWT